MSRIITATVGIAVVATLVSFELTPATVGAQGPACLHEAGESPAEASRRTDAVRFARAVNTAQLGAFSRTRSYPEVLANLPLPPTPDGFSVQSVSNLTGYVFSVKDTRDPCGWAVFSDQAGLIYTARPLK